MRQKFGLFVFAAALAATGAQAKSITLTGTGATATQFTNIGLSYKVYLGGARIAKLNVNMSIGERDYWVNATGRTTGLLDKVVRTRFSGSSHGALDKGHVRPKTHNRSLRQRKKSQAVEITYDKDGVPEIKSTPPFKKSSKRSPLLAKTLIRTIDPASIFISPVVEGKSVLSPDQCNRRIRVLDGQRRVDIIYKHKASYGAYRIRKPKYLGPALLCTARIIPIGGVKHNGLWPKLAGQKPVEMLLVPMAGNKYLVPMRIVTGSPLGKIVVRVNGYSTKNMTGKLSLHSQ